MKLPFAWDKKQLFAASAGVILVTGWLATFFSEYHMDTAKKPTAQSTSGAVQKKTKVQATHLASTMLVYVVGAVYRPGLYSFALDARVYQALKKAGGPTKEADMTAVNLAAVMEDGTEIVIPAKTSSVHQTGKHPAQMSSSVKSHKLQPGQHLLLNSASLDQLEQLPGVGPKKAQEILLYRSKHGKFLSLSDLHLVKGIGSKLLAKVLPFLSLR